MQTAFEEHGSKLDIVYEDAELPQMTQYLYTYHLGG